MLWYMAKEGTRLLVVNGRLSPRSFKGYIRFSMVLRGLFRPVERWLMQSDYDRFRLINTGVVPPSKAITVGNLKFDTDWKGVVEKGEVWRHLLGISQEEPVVVAGSTHQGEEEAILKVFGALRRRFPGLKLVLGPRDIDRAKSVKEMGIGLGFVSYLRTEVSKTAETWDVMVLDTIGELREVYGVGSIAFVGGSLVPIGGHNMLEPAAHGLPVLFGPHCHNFQEISELLIEAGGGLMVRDALGLERAMEGLLKDGERRGTMGRRARDVAFSHQGATKRVLDIIRGLLPSPNSQ
jgi:3-deoxy-D-manno-octulosonic-acid transferase